VNGRDGIAADFYGNPFGRFCLPGPFASLKDGKVYSIDPRKQLT